MNLIRAEVRRLFKRRITRYALLLMVLSFVVIAASFSYQSEKIGPKQMAAAEAAARHDEELARKSADQERADCEEARKAGKEFANYPADMDCADITGPSTGEFDPRWYLPYEFDFRKQFGTFVSVFAAILALFGFIVGASYVGAEWNSGGMTNLLLWRPKRLTVLFTKLGVLLGGVLTIAIGLGALWTLALWSIGRYDGRLGKLTAGAWQSFALDGARGLGLVLAMTAVGFALASIGRHTAMALGAAVAVGVVSEIGLRIAVSILGVAFGDRYVLSTYAVSWLQKKYTLFDYQSCEYSMGECSAKEYIVTWQDSALVFGVGTAVILLAAAWLMRRRDIT